jgi:Mrp family chromosome partitioning ATPase
MGSGRIEIVSTGDRPLGPFKDQRKMLAGGGAAAGTALGVGLVLLLGLADRRLHSSADASMAVQRSASSRLLGILPSLTDDVKDADQTSMTAHCVHHIRALLQIRRGGIEQRTFMVTSPAAGDGKTSLTLGLGVSFAGSNSRTLMIDCDIIGGGLSARAGRFLRGGRPDGSSGEPSVGLPDVLRGEPVVRCAIETGIPNLSVLTLASASDHHVAQLSPSTMARIIEEARRSFDTVLIDTGPILGSLEASIVAGVVDGVVLTVSRGEQRPLAEQAVDFLNAAGARVAGIVFNRARAADLVASSSVVSARSVARTPGRTVVTLKQAVRERFSELGPIACAVAGSSAIAVPANN